MVSSPNMSPSGPFPLVVPEVHACLVLFWLAMWEQRERTSMLLIALSSRASPSYGMARLSYVETLCVEGELLRRL